MAQFLIVDDGPLSQYKPNDPRYWGSFQTGLETQQGKRKPSYSSSHRPFEVLPRRARRGRRMTVFGQLRTAASGARLTAHLQFRAAGSHRWRTVANVGVANARDAFTTRVRARRSGAYRIAWQGGPVTRAGGVRVRG